MNQTQNINKRALLLLSGGIDSTACLHFLLSNSFTVSSIFIDYGQPSGIYEEQHAIKIASHFSVPFEKIKISPIKIADNGFIKGRNFMLFSTALMSLDFDYGVVATGIHSGTDYLDCSPIFLQKVQDVYDIYTQGQVQIFTPFLYWKKIDTWNYCKKNSLPVELTYSCENGLEQPCGKCISCADLIKLYGSKVD